MSSKKTRLLMGIPHPNARGGPPTHLPQLVEYFDKHDDYVVKTFYYGSKLFGTDRGQKETKLRKLLVTAGTLVEYLYLLVTYRPHIVHLNTSFDKLTILRDLPFSVVSRIFGKRLIFKIHGNSPDLLYTENHFQIFIIKLIFWGATRIGVLSVTEIIEYRKQFGYEDKLIVTKNIVSSIELEAPADVFEEIVGEHYGLFISRIEEMKGLQDLIHALPLIRRDSPNFKLIVAGDGPDLKNSIELAERLELTEAIRWLGYVDNQVAQCLYQKCDVFVFPTHYPEGMPMVLVEALRSGIPIVTSQVWFAVSYLKDGVNCLFAERGNPSDLSAQIVAVLNDCELQTIMRRENPRIVGKFRKATVGKEFDDIYQNMLLG